MTVMIGRDRTSINVYRDWLNDYILARSEGHGEEWIEQHRQ